jgi:hypothetical protein
MDSSDLKWFALLAVIGLGLYVAFLRGDSRRAPALDVANSPTVSYTPIGIPGGK